MLHRSAAKFFIAISALAQANVMSAAETLSLDEAISISLENNRTVQSSALDTHKAEDRLAATRCDQAVVFSLS